MKYTVVVKTIISSNGEEAKGKVEGELEIYCD